MFIGVFWDSRWTLNMIHTLSLVLSLPIFPRFLVYGDYMNGVRRLWIFLHVWESVCVCCACELWWRLVWAVFFSPRLSIVRRVRIQWQYSEYEILKCSIAICMYCRACVCVHALFMWFMRTQICIMTKFVWGQFQCPHNSKSLNYSEWVFWESKGV